MQSPPPWTPLAALAARLDANLTALATRDAALAGRIRATVADEPYHIRVAGDAVTLGVGRGTPRELPCRITPAVASATAAGLCPAGPCDAPLLVAGEDLGWLWDRLQRTPCRSPDVPGWRPPLFFVMPDLDRLRALLHVHDWRAMLADHRVRLFAGPGAVADLRHAMLTDRYCPLPHRWVTADPAVWPAGTTVDGLVAEATARRAADAATLVDARRTSDAIANGRPLRVLGVTSRYTSFLQHSTRDWLAAFDRLGHTTRLAIESADHELTSSLTTADACAAFEPDLVVTIDHLRFEHPVVPPGVPFVAWVQDAMPHLHTAAAGRSQGDRDYVIGYHRSQLTGQFGYPPSRFLSCAIPCNDARFTPDGPIDPALACDVAYVSHASTPADVLFADAVKAVTDPVGRRALTAAFDRVAAVYAAGGSMTETVLIMRVVDDAFAAAGAQLDDADRPGVTELFVQRVNNAFFRHQALAWVADLGIDLRLYGNGWDRHPTLSRFARGPITSPDHLAAVHRASRIGLQVSPFGTVHQRVFEGLAAGGFMLLRACPGDVMERDYRAVWDWCLAQGVTTDADLLARSTPAVAERVAAIAHAWQRDAFDLHLPLTALLRMSADEGYVKSAGTIWGDDYDAVAFATPAQVRDHVAHYLADPAARAARAASMRRVVLDRFTYVATTRRLLEFIKTDLGSRNQYRTAA